MQLCLHAPPSWQEGQPLYFSHPPVPLPEEMRKGKLAEFNQRHESMYHDNSNNNGNPILEKEDDGTISQRISTYVSSALELKQELIKQSNNNNNNSTYGNNSTKMDISESKGGEMELELDH